MTERTVAVRLVARNDQYVKAMGQAQRATGTFAKDSAKQVSGVGKQFQDTASRVTPAWAGAMGGLSSATSIGVLAAGAVLGKFVDGALDQASALNESVNALSVTYGDNAKAVMAVGNNSAESFGLARSEFNQLAVQFSAFAKNIAKGSGQDVAGVLGDMTGRVADFASVMNIDLKQATQVFMSSLAGETEPIRRFGKDLSAASVEQYALRTNLIDTKDQMTEAIKVQARYGLLMEQTNDVTGDFANTSGEAANAGRILSAKWKDFQAQAGKELLPVLGDVLGALTAIVDVAGKLKIPQAFGGLDKLFKGAENWGKTTRAIFTEGSLETHNQKLVRQFEESEQAAADFDRTLLDGLDTFDEVRAKVLEVTESEHAANLVTLEWNEAHIASVTAYDAANRAATSYATVVASADAAAVIHKEHVDDVRESIFREGEITADTTAETYLKEQADKDAATAASIHEDAVEDLRNAFARLKDELSDRSAYLNIADSFDRVNEAAQTAWNTSAAGIAENTEKAKALDAAAAQAHAEADAGMEGAAERAQDLDREAAAAWQTVADGAEDATRKVRDHEQATIDLKQKVIDYVESVGGIPPEVATDINALIDEGSFAEAEAKLAWLERTREVALIITPQATTTNQYGRLVGAASGVTNWTGGPLVVGERGPELVDLPSGSTVHPAGSYAGSMGGSVNYTFAPGSIVLPNVRQPEQFINDFTQAVRFNGPDVIRRLLSLS